MTGVVIKDRVKISYGNEVCFIERIAPTKRVLPVPIQVIDWSIEVIAQLLDKPFDESNRVEMVSPYGNWIFYKSRYYSTLMLGYINLGLSPIPDDE